MLQFSLLTTSLLISSIPKMSLLTIFYLAKLPSIVINLNPPQCILIELEEKEFENAAQLESKQDKLIPATQT